MAVVAAEKTSAATTTRMITMDLLLLLRGLDAMADYI